MSEVVRVENLCKTYGSGETALPVLKSINLTIQEGQFTAIMGPSGGGKSTLMHLIGGLDRPTDGEVWLAGTALHTLNDKALARLRRQKVGFIFQFYNLIAVLSARENVAMPLILDGVARGEALKRADKVLDAVGLADRASYPPSKLSGGQQQRVSIARALVTEPAIILGDEPTGALDTHTGEEVIRLLRQAVNSLGRTVVMVTHDPRIAAFTDRIITLKDGVVIDDNTFQQGVNTPVEVRVVSA